MKNNPSVKPSDAGESPTINTEARFPRWSYGVTMTEGHDQFPDRLILRFMQQIVADVGHDEGTEQLFAEIVTACNSHAALVGALRNVSQDLADKGSVQPDTLAMIPAALSLAKEGTP